MDQNERCPSRRVSPRSGSARTSSTRSIRTVATCFRISISTRSATWAFGRVRRRWKGPYSINGALAKLMGDHQVKAGADLRRLGIATTTFNENAGTSPSAVPSPAGRVANSGHELASTPGAAEAGKGGLRSRGSSSTRVLGRLRPGRLARELELTLNYGVRFDHEDGLGRSRTGRPSPSTGRGQPHRRVGPQGRHAAAGTHDHRRRDLRRRGRRPRGARQPAGGHGVTARRDRVDADRQSRIRSGYGLFSAPWQYSATEHGQIGFARTTNLNQSSDATEVPLTTLDIRSRAGCSRRSAARSGC